ncbi:MAG: hypothetical protein Kow0098_03920 [Ignavibacteriaceae bacterium]
MNGRISSYIFFLFFLIPFQGTGNDKDAVLATVGSHQIYISQFSERYTDFLIAAGVNDKLQVRESILQNMINELLLYYYDDNSLIFNSSEYNRELEWTEKQAILAYLKDREIYAKITVTDEELRETFMRVNEQLAARHLYAPTEQEAYVLYDKLMNGEDFSELAKQVFTDSTLKNNGGYLGYFTWGDMDPAFEETAYSLNIGEISEPVKTQSGYSIIKLEDRKPHPLLTEYEFQTKKQKLERTLKIRKKKPAEKAFINSIFNENELIFNDSMISALLRELNNFFKDRSETPYSENQNSTVVEYAGTTYKYNDLSNRLHQIPHYHRKKITTENNLKTALKGLIIQDILLSMAYEKGYDTISVVKQTIDKMHNQVFLRYKMAEILDKSVIPDSALLNYYNMNILNFSTSPQIKIQEIIVEQKELADSIFLLIDKGEDFGKLAEIFSVRNLSASSDGIIGYSPKYKFGKFQDLFWKAEIGEVIGPEKFDKYYGIFKILGKKDPQPVEFEKVTHLVKQSYKQDMKRQIVEEYVSLISKNVKIEIDKNLLASHNIMNL